MYLGTQAEQFPDREAVVIGANRYTYADLESRSNQVAHACRQLGLRPGDGILLMLENRIEFFEIWWAAMRSGLYLTPVNWHLTPGEVAYLIRDSGAAPCSTAPRSSRSSSRWWPSSPRCSRSRSAARRKGQAG